MELVNKLLTNHQVWRSRRDLVTGPLGYLVTRYCAASCLLPTNCNLPIARAGEKVKDRRTDPTMTKPSAEVPISAKLLVVKNYSATVHNRDPKALTTDLLLRCPGATNLN